MEDRSSRLGDHGRYHAQISLTMPLQFYSVDPSVLESGTGQLSDLARVSKSNMVISDDSMVAFRVIHVAATDPSTPRENEVCSIDKLISCGNALYTPTNESFVHQLPKELLADAMIDFTRLTPDGFIELVYRYCTSLAQSVLYDQSADEILRDFSDPSSTQRYTLENYEPNDFNSDDLLNGFCWATLRELKGFVNAALEINCEVLRLNA